MKLNYIINHRKFRVITRTQDNDFEKEYRCPKLFNFISPICEQESRKLSRDIKVNQTIKKNANPFLASL